MKTHQPVRRYFLFLLPIFCLSVSGRVFAQTVEQAYDLRFQAGGKGFMSIYPYVTWLDSTQVPDKGLYSLKLRYHNRIVKVDGKEPYFSDDCHLLWSKTIPLPNRSDWQGPCTITLNYQSEMEELHFFVSALDKEERVLYADSVVLPVVDRWTDHSFSFDQSTACAVTVSLLRQGYNEADEEKSIDLKKVSIRIGDRILNDLPLTSLVDSSTTGLDPGAIVPLSRQDNASLDAIDWKDKKIIALGDAISGMQDILEARIQFAKHLIASANCQLIILDLPVDLCWHWNLYLQGMSTQSYEVRLQNDLKNSISGSALWLEFFRWIRQYNSTISDPVRVIGVREQTSSTEIADYLLNFATNRQDSVYWLNNYQKNRFKAIKNHILHSEIPEQLNKKDLQYLLFLLENREDAPVTFYELEIARYHAMYIEQAIDNYLSPTEKAVLFAASERINKQYPVPDTKVKELYGTKHPRRGLADLVDEDSLGNYLSRRYGWQYHAVSFHIGERTCLIDYKLPYYFASDSTEKESPAEWPSFTFPYAFEQAAMNASIPYFYYTSDRLPDSILGLNIFTNTRSGYLRDNRNTIPFRYCDIPAHFDALVFLRETKTRRDYTDYNRNLYHYYESDKYKFRRDLLDQLKKESSGK